MKNLAYLIELMDLTQSIIENFGTNEFTQKDYDNVSVNESKTKSECRSNLNKLYNVGVLVRTNQEFVYTNPLGENLTSIRYIYKLANDFENKIYNRVIRIQEYYNVHCTIEINNIDYRAKREQRYVCNFIEVGYYCPILKQVLGAMYKYKINEIDLNKAFELYNNGTITKDMLLSIYGKIKRKGNDFVLKLTPEKQKAYNQSLESVKNVIVERRDNMINYIENTYNDFIKSLNK